MAPSQTFLKTNFKPAKVIQPFYTGGKVALDQNGRLLVTTLGEDVLITDFETGDELARIEGVSMHTKSWGVPGEEKVANCTCRIWNKLQH